MTECHKNKKKRKTGEDGIKSNRDMAAEVSEEMLLHLNQYTDDIKSLKKMNTQALPFNNKTTITNNTN